MGLGPHLVVLRDDSWQCSGSQYGVSGTEPRSSACKTNVLPTILSLCSPNNFKLKGKSDSAFPFYNKIPLYICLVFTLCSWKNRERDTERGSLADWGACMYVYMQNHSLLMWTNGNIQQLSPFLPEFEAFSCLKGLLTWNRQFSWSRIGEILLKRSKPKKDAYYGCVANGTFEATNLNLLYLGAQNSPLKFLLDFLCPTLQYSVFLSSLYFYEVRLEESLL